MAEKLISTLLCGARTAAAAGARAVALNVTRAALAVALILVLAAPLAAQATASKAAQTAPDSTATPPGRLQVAVTYNATLTNPVSGANFWMQGGSAQIEGRFYRGLGAVADIAGAHTTNINSTGVGLDLVTAVFGPRYTFTPAHKKYSVFAQALAGEAFGFNSLFPESTGATSSHYGLAMEMGGGMDVNLSPHLALRAIQANWLRTQMPNSTNNAQNSLQLGAGVVFRFGQLHR